MNRADAVWLTEVFKPKRKLKIDKSSIVMFIEAINRIMGTNRAVPGCACEFKITAQIANSAFEQHEDEIEKLYNSKPKGRKKKK